MPELLIPKQSITTKQTKQGKEITCFVAMRDGELLSPCESFGSRKAQLEEAMRSGKPIEVEKVEFSEQWNRWSVWFPKGSGFQANYRDKFGQRPWTPAGYRGQPMPFAVWCAITGEVYAEMYAIVHTTVGDDPALAVACLEQARSLVAQYWMAVEHNITYPHGYEPVATSPQANANAPGNGTTQAPATAQKMPDAFEHEIANATEEHDVRGLMDSIKKTVSDKVRQAELLTMAFNRLRSLTMAHLEREEP